MTDPDKTWTGSILTISGVRVDLERPTWGSINIFDIAHSLSMQCRYNGHIPTFYSVAEHSCKVLDRLVENGHAELAFHGLLHDSPEAYLGDLVSPMKRIEDLGRIYRVYEEKMEVAIGVRFEVDLRIHNPLVKEADLAVYQWEVENIRAGKVAGLLPKAARDLFMDYYIKYGVE